jgi:DNA-binding Lrp family transcriptional regulator
MSKLKIFFSDWFDVSPQHLSAYGAFNISLINDLPVFVDPFLLFNSKKALYRALHDEIIRYVRFLRDRSGEGVSTGLLRSWYRFPEVKQTWLGYSRFGNRGSGLGEAFGQALNENLHAVFSNFGTETVTKGSHLEKLCLIKDGVGKDNISDFTTNLIKGFLCDYTQTFARAHVNPNRIKRVAVNQVRFNYSARNWERDYFDLPYIDGDFVLLTPKDILTKDDAWINKYDLLGDFDEISESLPNDELRSQVNDYFVRQIPADANRKEILEAVAQTVRKFPQIIDYYIKLKEDTGGQAVALSEERIREIQTVFGDQVEELVDQLSKDSDFYRTASDTFDETYNRVMWLKQVIEKNDLYRIFYVDGKPVKREADLQLMFRLAWYASPDDVNSEVNNGRGPVDYKISRGSRDSTLVEFKLASNSKLRQNLEHQLPVYEEANQTKKSIAVVMCFTDDETSRTEQVVKELGLADSKNVVLIDASRTNKPSGSVAR